MTPHRIVVVADRVGLPACQSCGRSIHRVWAANVAHYWRHSRRWTLI
jgi:hypothetical protein